MVFEPIGFWKYFEHLFVENEGAKSLLSKYYGYKHLENVASYDKKVRYTTVWRFDASSFETIDRHWSAGIRVALKCHIVV